MPVRFAVRWPPELCSERSFWRWVAWALGQLLACLADEHDRRLAAARF
jgi:hypothetical protein